MNLAILSNAKLPEPGDLLQRTASLAPSLAAALADDAGLSGQVRLFVAAPLSWPKRAGSVEILPLGSFEEAYPALTADIPDLVLIDFDPGAGKARDRLDFLQVAGTVAASAVAHGWSLALALAEEAGGAADADLFSAHGFSNRQMLTRLTERSSRLLTFSSAAASRLSKRFGRSFETVPASSLIPEAMISRRRARSRLGFSEESADLLLGVVGPYSGLALDLLQAGLREALRLSPGTRVLYLGPDGKRFRDRALPWAVPFLDAGLPSAEEVALRLRAMDMVLHPSREGCRPDDQVILASLRNGTPIISSTPDEGIDPLFGTLPEGFAIVTGNELGVFLEAIEQACERALSPTQPDLGPTLQAYSEARFSPSALRRGFLPVGI